MQICPMFISGSHWITFCQYKPRQQKKKIQRNIIIQQPIISFTFFVVVVAVQRVYQKNPIHHKEKTREM